MSDLRDTPDLSEKWCPTCQPDRDSTQEILQVHYCHMHMPPHGGTDDAGVVSNPDFSFNAGVESEGNTNRLFSEFLKKGKKMTPRVIGISGKIGAGKDAVAAHLVKKDFRVVRFSDSLKEEVLRILPKTCREIYRASYSTASGTATDEELRRMLWDDKPPIIRRLLQEWGTDLRRNENPSYWITKWEEKVESLLAIGSSIVSPDVRFLNEHGAVKKFGGEILRVDRPGVVLGDHVSELEADSLKYDYVIDNTGTLEHLGNLVDAYLVR